MQLITGFNLEPQISLITQIFEKTYKRVFEKSVKSVVTVVFFFSLW